MTGRELLGAAIALAVVAAFTITGVVQSHRIAHLQRTVNSVQAHEDAAVAQLHHDLSDVRAAATLAQQAAEAAAVRALRAREAERASRSERRLPLVTANSAAWASSAYARTVAACESGGDPTVISVHGSVSYFGKWQADSDFVATYAHTSAWRWVRAGRFTMPESQQDGMAYAGWLTRGWQPWSCAA